MQASVHLFGCERCTKRLEELVQLGAGIRAAFRGGGVRAVIPHALLDAMRQERLRLREYRHPPDAAHRGGGRGGENARRVHVRAYAGEKVGSTPRSAC
jgi:hypothetical protein